MANRTRDTANLVSANNLYVDISTDKVGIGTTTPTSKLTVVGDVLVSGILTAAHIVGTSLSISGISTLGTVEISSGIVTAKAGTGIVTYYGDGSKLLYVVASSSAVAIATNTTNQSQFLTYVTETGNVSGLGVTTTGLVFNPSTNSLGIGTITPTSKLTVQGDVSIASTLGIGTVIDIVPYDTLNSGTLSWEGSAGQLFSITNNLTTGSIHSVNDVSGIPSIDVDANGTIQLGPYGGNIGLGTTNPTAKLHVVGDVRVSGASTIGNLTITPVGTGATVGGIGVTYYGDGGNLTNVEDYFVIAASDESTDLTTGTDKVYFRMPYAGTLLAVRASVNTAPTDANIEVNINEDGSSLLSTILSIDASEKTSTTAAVPAVISGTGALTDDAEITIDIDQVGATTPGKGLKVYLKTRRN